jgi:hypothetical protein
MMKQLRTILLASLVSTGALRTACAIDTSKLPPPAQQQGVTYAKDIQPILEASCVRCHGTDRPKGGLRLNSLDGLMKGGKDGKVVTPGDSAKSQLVIAVSQLDPELTMPPKPRPGRQRGGQPGPGASQPGTNAPAANPPGGPPGAGGFGRPMGPPPKPLTPEQVGLVRAWIDQGAK